MYMYFHGKQQTRTVPVDDATEVSELPTVDTRHISEYDSLTIDLDSEEEADNRATKKLIITILYYTKPMKTTNKKGTVAAEITHRNCNNHVYCKNCQNCK